MTTTFNKVALGDKLSCHKPDGSLAVGTKMIGAGLRAWLLWECHSCPTDDKLSFHYVGFVPDANAPVTVLATT